MLKGLIRSCIVPHIVLVFICTSCTALPAVVLDGNLDDLRKRTEIRERRGGLRQLFENYSPRVRDSVLLPEDSMEHKIGRATPHRVVTLEMFNFTDLVSSPLFMSPHLSFRRKTSHPSHGQDLNQEVRKTLQGRARSKRMAGQEQSVCDEIQEYAVFSEPVKDQLTGQNVTVIDVFSTRDLNDGEYIHQLFTETKCNLSHESETSKGCRGIDKTHWTSSCVAKKSVVPAIVELANGKLRHGSILLSTSCNCALKKKDFVKEEPTMCDVWKQMLTTEQEKAEGEGQGRGEVGEGAGDSVDDNNGRKSETTTASGSAEDAEERKERRRHQRPTSKESRKSRRRRRRRRQRSREKRIRRRQDHPPTDLASPDTQTNRRSRHGSN
ncbi:neurotrophic factor BDNF precursor form-like isoform X1 [Branchiostoma floridae x Branchiostoma belcheri]